MIAPIGSSAGLQEKLSNNGRSQNPDLYRVAEDPVEIEIQDATPQVPENSLAVAALRDFLHKEFPDMTDMNRPGAYRRKIHIGPDRQLFKKALELEVETVRDNGQQYLCRLLIDRDYRPIPEEAIVVFEAEADEREKETGSKWGWIADETVYQHITSYEINKTAK